MFIKIFSAVAICLSAVFFYTTTKSPEPEEFVYFDDTCSVCDVSQDDLDIVDIFYFYDTKEDADISSVVEDQLSKYNYELHSYDVLENAIFFEDFMYDLNLQTSSFPIIVIGGNILSKNFDKDLEEQLLVHFEEQRNNVDVVFENSLKTDELFNQFEVDVNKNTLLYFYRIGCESCINITDTMLKIDESQVDILRFNTRSGRNIDRLYVLFDKYQVLEEDRVVPIIFLNDTYLAGDEAINEFLLDYIKEDKGLLVTLP